MKEASIIDEMNTQKSSEFVSEDKSMAVLWDAGPCSLVKIYRRFRPTY
jgi:hypothetical protein